MNLLDEKIYANALNSVPSLGPVSLTKLYNLFGSWISAWKGDGSDYIQAGLLPKIVNQIIADKRKINPEQSFAELARRQIETLLVSEKAYPKLLKEIIPAPPLLYIRGKLETLHSLTVGVVGTRKVSAYGTTACEDLVLGLVTNGVTIASGLAFGVDAVALNTAVNNSGRCIAVLASDLDNASISPKVNFNLAQRIMDNGCLVSEFPLGIAVQKGNFLARNRIISGLSVGTLVIEADRESGALITANYSLEQNREVFAVPGSIFSATSRGTNHLIKQGAKLVTSAFDILEELNISNSPLIQADSFEATAEETQILELLSQDPMHIDDLIKTIKLSPAIINSSLTMLEMKGRIKNLGGATYVKIR